MGSPRQTGFLRPLVLESFLSRSPTSSTAPDPRITLLVHRILVVHTAIETQFLRNASTLATPPYCYIKTSLSPKTLQRERGK